MAIPVAPPPDPAGMALVTDLLLTLIEQFPLLIWQLPQLPTATLRFPVDRFSVTVQGPDGNAVGNADNVPLGWQLYRHVFMLDRKGTGFLAGAEIAWIKHVTVLRLPDALTITLTMGSPPRGPER
jgi:hypothetical protein